jgi:hypothetical protein
MDREALRRLVERARSDAEFFHKLVFDPETVLAELDIDRPTKGNILGLTPEQLIGFMTQPHPRSGEFGDQFCEPTCGNESCFTTCGSPVTCDLTCTSSCGETCKRSCGDTTYWRPLRKF